MSIKIKCTKYSLKRLIKYKKYHRYKNQKSPQQKTKNKTNRTDTYPKNTQKHRQIYTHTHTHTHNAHTARNSNKSKYMKHALTAGGIQIYKNASNFSKRLVFLIYSMDCSSISLLLIRLYTLLP